MTQTRQGLTTAFGVFVLILGATGIYIPLVKFFMGNHGANYSLFVLETSISLFTKLGLIAVGIMLLQRSQYAATALGCVLIFSLTDSLILYWAGVPMPAHVTELIREARTAGYYTGLLMGPVFYLIVLSYLMLPRTLREFEDHGRAMA